MPSTRTMSVFCVSVFSNKSICTTVIAVRNREVRVAACHHLFCRYRTRYTIPTPVPTTLQVIRELHELTMNFQRFGILCTQIYEVKLRCILLHALFRLLKSMSDLLEVRCEGYFIGDFPILNFLNE